MAAECDALLTLSASVNAQPSEVSSCPQRMVLRIIEEMRRLGQETVLSRGERTRAVAARSVHCRSSQRHAGLFRINILAAMDVAGRKSKGGQFGFELAGHRET